MRLLVLYGSETGTAQDVAEQIWRESKRLGYMGPVLAMDEYPVHQLITERLVIFVVATAGDGNEPGNMRKSWRFLLRRNLPSNSLTGLRYGCLGLGDSSYSKFNYAAKKLNKRLQALGGMPFMALGLCDDQHDHGFGRVALTWIKDMWDVLKRDFPSLNRKQHIQVNKWQINVLHNMQEQEAVDLNFLKWPSIDPHYDLMVNENIRTTAADHFQDVRLIKFKYPAGVSWSPGDIVQIRPCNSNALVNTFFAIVHVYNLGFTEDTYVELKSLDIEMPLPLAYSQKLSIGLLAKYIWDFSARPRQRFFELLAQNCTDELEREKLIEFTTAEGLDDLINYVNRPRRTIIEVLQDFPHATSMLTLDILFEMMPMIQARSFSIASDGESIISDNTLDLLVAVVDYKTKLQMPRLGLCSNWLKTLEPEAVIPATIKRGTMILPSQLHIPLIMVGPGTGIAPFRSIIQNRLRAHSSGVDVGSMIVFFGCRNKTKDFHFEADFGEWTSTKIVNVFYAFSRDQPHKVYVQDLIKECGDLLRTLIQEDNAHIYVAGSSNNMPKAVKEAFIEVLDGDRSYMEKLCKSNRYQEETWA